MNLQIFFGIRRSFLVHFIFNLYLINLCNANINEINDNSSKLIKNCIIVFFILFSFPLFLFSYLNILLCILYLFLLLLFNICLTVVISIFKNLIVFIVKLQWLSYTANMNKLHKRVFLSNYWSGCSFSP